MILTILTIFILLCVTAIILEFTITVWMDLYERIWGSNAEYASKLLEENRLLERKLRYYEYRLGMVITSSDIQVAKKIANEALEAGKSV